jgi:LacI family transcriptional regulator
LRRDLRILPIAKKQIGIRELAERAGVHVSTVSRVINARTRHMVSQEVAERILKIADELGYRRNQLASALRMRRSFMVGVLIPDLTNPVFPSIVRGIESVLTAEGYIPLLADTFSSPATELAIVDSLRSRAVDGLILATAHRDDETVRYCRENGMPFVLVNRTTDDDSVRAVVNDESFGIKSAVKHLVDLGHRQIAFVGGPLDTSTGWERHAAFTRCIKELQLASTKRDITICHEFTETSGRSGLASLLDNGSRFTAVIAANDRLALGCYDALADVGLICPTNVSVVGYNDMPLIDRVNPPLTTVRIAHGELGSQAARLLLDGMRDEAAQPRVIRLRPSLVVRNSTARPSARAIGRRRRA